MAIRGGVAGPDEDVSPDVEDFLLSKPDTGAENAAEVRVRQLPTRSEMTQATLSPYNLLPVLLSRDNAFASSISTRPTVHVTVLELIDHHTTELLDRL